MLKNMVKKVLELLVNDWNEAIKNGEMEPNAFVISPFSAVQNQIKQLVKSRLPHKTNIERGTINRWVNKSIGTVHTFQGKKRRKYTL